MQLIYEKLPKDIARIKLQAPQGIHGLCKKHPMVKIMTSEIDASLTGKIRRPLLWYRKLKKVARISRNAYYSHNTPKTAKNEGLNGALTVSQDKVRY
ncbi:hypothetical protein Bca4012_052902 [Brassica carinata]